MFNFKTPAVSPARLQKAVAPVHRVNTVTQYAAQRTIESAFARFEETPEKMAPSPGDVSALGVAVAEACQDMNDKGKFKGRVIALDDKLAEALDDAIERRASRLSTKTKRMIANCRNEIIDKARIAFQSGLVVKVENY